MDSAGRIGDLAALITRLMAKKSHPRSLVLVVDSSGHVQAAQLVDYNWAHHEFNRLIDHFQFGCSGWDTLQPVSDTFVIELGQTKPDRAR